MSRLRFEPRVLPTLATLLLLAGLLRLGVWQADKGERRAAEIAQHSQRAHWGPYPIGAQLVESEWLQDAPVTVRGTYEPEHQFYVDNRQEDGKPGVHVVTPLRIEGSTVRILVNRGWAGWTQGRQVLPVVKTPAGVVQVTGVATVPHNKNFFLMPSRAESLPRLWNQLDMERFAQERPDPLQPVVVLQGKNDASDGLIRNWQPPEDRVAKHQSYAYQWFGMAVALLVFYVVSSVRTVEGA